MTGNRMSAMKQLGLGLILSTKKTRKREEGSRREPDRAGHFGRQERRHTADVMAPRRPIQPLPVRVAHGVNAFAMVCMLMSGRAIYNQDAIRGQIYQAYMWPNREPAY
jgi:hypothetical protein